MIERSQSAPLYDSLYDSLYDLLCDLLSALWYLTYTLAKIRQIILKPVTPANKTPFFIKPWRHVTSLNKFTLEDREVDRRLIVLFTEKGVEEGHAAPTALLEELTEGAGERV